MKRFSKITIRRLTALSLGAITIFGLFGERILWTKTDRDDQPADAVIVLAGSDPEDRLRVHEAVALYHRSKAAYLILPIRHPAFSWSWAVRTYRLDLSPTAQRILIGRSGRANEPALERPGGTFAEAQESVHIMQRYGLRSAVVVSSGYHMRRTALAFDRIGKSAGIQFSYHPVGEPDPFWWLQRGKIAEIACEYPKLIAALFVYPSR